ncbi:MAG: Uma2 family endonuclease [Chloroflexi bacterium]|nr:Uma2 family endonuclease [Chloroflexota bacterium]
MTQLPTRRLFTVDEYVQMGAVGILGEDDRVELVEGEVFRMPPIGSRHAACVERVRRRLERGAVGQLDVRVQNPIRLDDFSEPVPDVVIVQPRADFYAARHPGPRDVFLVIEVSDTSAGYDRSKKAALYGRAGIPEMWLLDLTRGLIEVRTFPGPAGYQNLHVLRRGDTLAPLALPELVIDGAELLG